MRLLQCPNCGWVHFGVSRAHVENEVKRFNDYFDILPVDVRIKCYDNKPSSVEKYEQCFKCGFNNLKLFRNATTDVYGSTVQPIIDEEEV